MRRRLRMKILLVLCIIGGVVFALIGFAYLSSVRKVNPAFHFLTDREPWHSNVRESPQGEQTVTVYCFFGYHDNVSHMARKELLELGYMEVTAAIRYDGDYRFNPRDRNITTGFLKVDVFTSTAVNIRKGRFLEELPDGNLSFSNGYDWINVVIRQTKSPFSFRRAIQYWSNKLLRRSRRQRTAPMRP